MGPNQQQRLQLNLQKMISLLCFPMLFPLIIFWLKYVQKYKIKELAAIRAHFKKIKKNHPNGLLICPNHLTFIDSILLIWAFASPWSYVLNFKTLCWNLPKAKHVKASRLYRAICYIGKCLLITEDLKRAQHTMDKASYLLNSGQYVMVFPEGTRSKTGCINTENFVYGVGKLLIDSQQDELLCVYLRGDKQKTASKMPIKSEQFSIEMKLVSIKTELTGRRAMRDVSTQMINELVNLEQTYLAKQS